MSKPDDYQERLENQREEFATELEETGAAAYAGLRALRDDLDEWEEELESRLARFEGPVGYYDRLERRIEEAIENGASTASDLTDLSFARRRGAVNVGGNKAQFGEPGERAREELQHQAEQVERPVVIRLSDEALDLYGVADRENDLTLEVPPETSCDDLVEIIHEKRESYRESANQLQSDLRHTRIRASALRRTLSLYRQTGETGEVALAKAFEGRQTAYDHCQTLLHAWNEHSGEIDRMKDLWDKVGPEADAVKQAVRRIFVEYGWSAEGGDWEEGNPMEYVSCVQRLVEAHDKHH